MVQQHWAFWLQKTKNGSAALSLSDCKRLKKVQQHWAFLVANAKKRFSSTESFWLQKAKNGSAALSLFLCKMPNKRLAALSLLIVKNYKKKFLQHWAFLVVKYQKKGSAALSLFGCKMSKKLKQHWAMVAKCQKSWSSTEPWLQNVEKA